MQSYPKFEASAHRLPRRLKRNNVSEKHPAGSNYFPADVTVW